MQWLNVFVVTAQGMCLLFSDSSALFISVAHARTHARARARTHTHTNAAAFSRSLEGPTT